MTTTSGAPEWTYQHEPFGAMKTVGSDGAPTANAYKFAGEYNDPTGLYHLRARQYDPNLGAFSTPDPVERSLRDPLLSSYSYAENRPTVFVDPSGETAAPSDAPQQALYRAVGPEAASVSAVRPGATDAQTSDAWTLRQTLRKASSQTTLIRGHHEACGGWLVSQEANWGRVTAKTAFLKSVRFRYYVPLGVVLLGDRVRIHSGNGYQNYRGDLYKPYVAQSRTNSYAGSFFLPVNRLWIGGQIGGSVAVFVEKHTQMGDFVLGDDCHGELTIAYWVP